MNFLGELLNALGLERASLVGISMGGAVVVGYALRAPERVDRLALMNAYGLGEEVPWPRVSYALVRRPFVNELTWWILRHSKRVIRWSLGSLVHEEALLLPVNKSGRIIYERRAPDGEKFPARMSDQAIHDVVRRRQK